ncbi:hypothetical protein, partial [Pseudomonas rossensis]|uniref:hypothetical protein n=1 Tax=Pseudomonas rossensis TaxID=2305471 RepID=UPI003CD0DB16
FFDFGVGTHHDGLAPERNREHSIGHQVSAWNVGFMERLQRNGKRETVFSETAYCLREKRQANCRNSLFCHTRSQ